MQYTKFTANGYTFTLVYTFHRDTAYGGIVSKPDDAAPDNPAWQDAFAQAKRHYDQQAPYHRIVEIDSMGDGPLREPYKAEVEACAALVLDPQGPFTHVQRAAVTEMLYGQPYAARAKRPKPEPRAGYVYLVKSPLNVYKIGRTIDPDSRRHTFEVKLPFEIEFEAIIAAPDMIALERELHQRFARKRLNGEWFELEPQDIEYIKSLQGD